MAQENEIQSSYYLTEVKSDPLGKGGVDYANIIQLGFMLPHFTLPDAFGKEFSLKQQIGRHNLILTFLHRLDCSCSRPFLEKLKQHLGEIQAHNGQLVAISIDHPRILVNLIRQMQIEFPILYDAERTAIRLYTVIDRDSVRQEPHPAIFMADTLGVIRHKDISLGHADKLSIPALLDNLKEI
jgi:peroxiredoxin